MTAGPARARAVSIAQLRRTTLAGAAIIVTFTAWWWLGRMAVSPGPHAAHPGHTIAPDAASFLAAVVMWQVMMIAMMTPTLVPWVLAFEKLSGTPEHQRVIGPSSLFAAGYFVVWLGYSVLAASAQLLLQQAGLLDLLLRVGAPAGGVVLVAAGLVQVTPIKQACLAHCRSPLSYFLARWDDGPPSAWRLGLSHGAYCLGCCWALMATGFALGLMNLAWMALLTLILCVEQLAPRGDLIGKVLGVAMAAYGVTFFVF